MIPARNGLGVIKSGLIIPFPRYTWNKNITMNTTSVTANLTKGEEIIFVQKFFILINLYLCYCLKADNVCM